MDKKREKLKKKIEEADIPESLKAKELEVVNDQSLSTPEVEMELSRIISEQFDQELKESGVKESDLPLDEEVEALQKEFEKETKEAEKELSEDLELVEQNLQEIEKATQKIQEVESAK